MQGVIAAYAAALIFSVDENMWLTFTRAKEWHEFKGEKPTRGNQGQALKFTLRFVNGMTGTSATKRASKHYRALQSLFAERKTPDEALDAIQAVGGLEKMAKLNAAAARDKPVKAPDIILKFRRSSAANRLAVTAPGTYRVMLEVTSVNGTSVFAVKKLRAIA
jgi:hypothetical protein